MIAIRTSHAGDAARLLEIWRRAVDATHDFLSVQDRRAIEGEVADYVASAALLVAEEDGVALGFLGSTGRHVDALFVDPGAHGRGIGRALMAAADAATVDVNERNEGAIAFYRTLGYRSVGRSATDDAGRPYPIVHLRRAATSKNAAD